MIANDFPTILGAALAGVGLAQVPEPIALEHVASGSLAEVLPNHVPKIPGVFLYFSERRHVLPKLRAFIEYVKANPVRVNWPSRKRPTAFDPRSAAISTGSISFGASSPWPVTADPCS